MRNLSQFSKYKNFSSLTLDLMKNFHFTSAVKNPMISTQSQKTTAEPGNSNNKTLANNCTPLNRAFFVRNICTPKERLLKQACSSLVAYSGKGFALCCVPMFAVFQPVIRYRPKTGNFSAVTLKNLTLEIRKMYQFIFVAINRTDLTNKIHKIRIIAESERQARAKLARQFVLVFAGKINLKTNRTFQLNNTQGGFYA